MSKEPTPAKQPGWLDAVAKRYKYSRKDVQAFVKKYKIPLTPALGNPKRIHITSVVFSGKKEGLYTNDFEFRFDNLAPGIWGLFSDGNGKGKSSVLEVIKWLIKGRVSDGLQSGVKNWIRHAVLGFRIDKIDYQVEIHQEGDLFNGEIKRAPDGVNWQAFRTFGSEEEMAVVMSDFMLDQLELEPFASYKKGDNELDSGSEVTHGWPALSAAMFIGTSYGAIFGDTAMSGLPNRILNMYMGLPWIPTQAALKALEGQLKGTSAVENLYVDKAKEDRKKRLLDIQGQLEAKRSALSKLPQPQKSRQEYNKLIEEYNRAYELSNDAKRRLTDVRPELEIIEASLKADRISLQHFKEDNAARQIFKQLNPTCCPHCEQKISQEQLEKEKTQHTCAICDRAMIDSQDSEELLNELTEKLQASTKAHQVQAPVKLTS